jgi:hypothetical protein
MRDAFYTILTVWIIWRIIGAFSTYGNKRGSANNYPENKTEEGKTTIKHTPPTSKKISDDEGEYVDYEEIK